MERTVVICECFARDGLQHETVTVPTDIKIELINAFTAVGFDRIEATSYSNPVRIPSFADAPAVLAGITRRQSSHYKATCPNRRAIERAIADTEAGYGADELSLLVSATESHTQRNLGTTRDQQWQNIADMVKLSDGRFRLVGVLSMAFGCPFEGKVDETSVLTDIGRFAALGVTHVSVCDTTGHATPSHVKRLFRRIADEMPDIIPIAHFHDSRGSGIANCVAAFDAGCRWFDSAFGGVGGHPAQIRYGQGYTGNVATEDLVNLFEAEGIHTGLDLTRLSHTSQLCEKVLGRELHSRVARAGFGHLAA
ncbi:hydroxymethylglutaryl-CoA lyase [Phyllobacterium myrsinacearum]|uniref:Hydroxymethylglutaryl-CoA lyase n=1 Tax=Phyllobacterium myrsinacearum TaxID=28101 RepID=A0A2S9JAW9_9HYPH|nr:hydroxymethylglutaryl-CoA lyase [Phyllobacterium myrsinacearum]PRD49936.1 hydroxymethylglutaryl-CoA lyase [Phyllobacterium myrsinacearum]PWV86568.1 hydroxymethylglutaryl-CoA lyase [Phyllobacterium myrsinacearum]RZU96920.1 hydroxymethylglutaryl-CoA lyase [Phyllobacterium myrsinacearum]